MQAQAVQGDKERCDMGSLGLTDNQSSCIILDHLKRFIDDRSESSQKSSSPAYSLQELRPEVAKQDQSETV